MAQLAKHHDGKTLTRLEELAQREDISANFLVQILNDLRRAGIVESRRGKAGGYLLSRNPREISLRQIVDAMDPALLQSSLAASGESGAGIRTAWLKVSANLRETMEGITLETMATQPGDPMFYI